jgi:hypothetical protein
VLEVVRSDDSICLWLFSEPIAAIHSASGLHTALGGNAMAPELIGAHGIGVQYAADAPRGSAWNTILGSLDIEFVSGNALADGSGLVA